MNYFGLLREFITNIKASTKLLKDNYSQSVNLKQHPNEMTTE